MIFTRREFFKGAERSADLLKKGMVMNLNLGETAPDTTLTADILSLVKSALPIYQQQQVFNQQLKAGQTPLTYGAAPVVAKTNWTQIAMLGGAGVLAVVLLKSMLGRKRR
jgi:hypothetical protein